MNNKRINKLIKNLRKQQKIIKRKLKNIEQNKDFKNDITELLLDLSYAKAKVIELKHKKNLINPLKFNKDMNFKRRKWLFLRGVNYCKKYKQHSW